MVSSRNKGFEATHQVIIETAVSLISGKGVDALSMAAISRAAGVNRTTLYYHFAHREELIEAVKDWSAQQLTRGFSDEMPREERIAHITRFVLENSEVAKLFIDDFLTPGDIRTRYPRWDALVSGIARDARAAGSDNFDAEIYSLIMLTAAFIAPRVFVGSVRPDMPVDEVVDRFSKEHLRVLKRDGLLDG
ncbi:TetR/AcrR family transcriptional regulator [Novosphingobium sp. P6W]|uniref:TetR/AcrR family transcriptional regulator n=1 Tax=Novosphingobium sp. P6W TaxID=1609758 RepID=UPI0005C2EAC6|nr:TetR/AcrR family transcriptional regulator [Novosphingobium sp. P6W]AXB80533.1 TetR/AcrR family transcriptional regulator [Novosphingobium sp. P6W]KIS30376.1 TetR family transcriptional regulator [Novosphingobium sp. P6W]